MATSSDIATWIARGGTIKEQKKRKSFVAPTGETFKSWEEASTYMTDKGSEDKRLKRPAEEAEPDAAQPQNKQQRAAGAKDKAKGTKERTRPTNRIPREPPTKSAPNATAPAATKRKGDKAAADPEAQTASAAPAEADGEPVAASKPKAAKKQKIAPAPADKAAEAEPTKEAPKKAVAKKQKVSAAEGAATGQSRDTPATEAGKEAPAKEAPKKTAAKKKKAAAEEASDKGTDAEQPKNGAKKQKVEAPKHSEPVAEKDAQAPSEEDKEGQVSKSGRGNRQATQGVSYKEKGVRGAKGDTVAVREEHAAESEQAAIEALGKDKKLRLVDFSVFDDNSEPQPLDRVEHHSGALYASGAIYPSDGTMSKDKGQRVAKLGPVTGWSQSDDGSTVQIILKTPLAEYVCTRAATAYRKIFAHLIEQADIAFEVQKALSPSGGGNPAASLEEIVARLTRARVGKSYANPRTALLLNGNFVLSHLKAYDGKMGATSILADTQFADALRLEVEELQSSGGGNRTGAIVINEPRASAPATADALPDLGSAEKRAMQADADYARQLQGKMDMQDARGANKRGGNKGAAYIKISEEEIADDYPEPAQYDKVEEETDELLLMDEELFGIDAEDLPRRVLSDFSVYNAEGMLSTLELLPMWGGAEPDTELFASGVVLDDDGEWAGGQSLDAPAEGGSSAGASASAGGSGSGSAAGQGDMRIFSSQILEWIVEYSCDMLFISIRTDASWYRLSKPAPKYAPWFNVVLKCARLAVKILTHISEETRASRLSFNDVIKRLASTSETDPTFISTKPEAVERFVVVHGQILQNQFKNYPVKAVKNSAFAATLKERMEQRRHSKLYLRASKAVKVRGANRNPMRDRASVRAKPMTATATSMVRAIWQSYFPSNAPADACEEAAEAVAAVEVEEDLNEEDDEAEEENALAESSSPKGAAAEQAAAKIKVSWEGTATNTAAGNTFYSGAKVGDVAVALGNIVQLAAAGGTDANPLGLVQALWQGKKGGQQVQVRSVVPGSETVLGDAASQDELFVTSIIITRPAQNITGKVTAMHLKRNWSLKDRKAYLAEDEARRERNAAAAAESKPLEFFYRTLYLPKQGMFCQLPADLKLGSLQEEEKEPETGIAFTADGQGLVKEGVTYAVGDFLFLTPGTLDELEDAAGAANPVAEYAAKGRFHKGGANAGLRPFGIAQLVKVQAAAAGKKAAKKDAAPSKVEVLRFYRPEDISQDTAYKADFWDVYASNEQLTVDVADIVGKCNITTPSAPVEDTFVCRKIFSRKDGKFSAPPASLQPGQKIKAQEAVVDKGKGKATAMDNGKGKASVADTGKGKAAAVDDNKGKAPLAAAEPVARRETAGIDDGISLATMDIFAGCGGLSEGLHQARAAHTKWAIEYEEPAAEAFKLNHPDATVWAANCNVILTAAMHKAGLADICTASPEAEEQAAKLDAATLSSLPLPGDVDFLCGGPPCQGYSGMNRFNKGNWSMVQNSMVMAYLSFADFYRPRYFLLENVRNFVSHNKSFTFRLTLRSLLDMGYQVRFGVLNAGNFGVSQSRKRTFIWAAAPSELLPDWPRLLHVFRSPQLTINLPGNVQYTAVDQTDGAPLRTVTVRDVISDLPPITNGHSQVEMEYSGPAISAFQKKMRGGVDVKLTDHICKEMNPLNLERCRCIPKNQPGADWRVLQQIVEEDPSREKFQGQPLVPWCLPNTADRHNGWRGLFGRLDFNGHFPTSTTDPQPMGKVGQVFHPDQDRIVSVRECARAQGFPDSFRFYGNVHNKHRQIGNAVPPPLAYNLGRCLRRALETTAHRQNQAILDAQLGRSSK